MFIANGNDAAETEKWKMKHIYNMHNEQGAYLMQVTAKNEQCAIRQAKKQCSGKLTATQYGN